MGQDQRTLRTTLEDRAVFLAQEPERPGIRPSSSPAWAFCASNGKTFAVCASLCGWGNFRFTYICGGLQVSAQAFEDAL